jgi:hypothetical protein
MTNSTFAVTIVSAHSDQGRAEFLAQELSQMGLTARFASSQPERGASEVILMVVLAVPIRTFLEAFGSSLGNSAGTAVKNLIQKTLGAGRQNVIDKCVLVRDPQRGIDFEFTDDLPVEAYDKVGRISPTRPGTLRYVRAVGEWIYTD